MDFVIGIDGGSTKCLIKAKDMQGNLLAEATAPSTNHHHMPYEEAAVRIRALVGEIIHRVGARKQECRCVVVGAAGIDSPADKQIVQGFYGALGLACPIFCMNDGSVALYATTQGVGTLAISGTGSIAVGRNAKGEFTRSGGYATVIFGDEGSSRWIALQALGYMSKWVDKSVSDSPLTRMISEYFHGLDADKLVALTRSLRSEPVPSELAVLVDEAAKGGDPVALGLLRSAAKELFLVSATCVRKLGFDKEPSFRSGVWGSVFVHNKVFYEEYKRLFEESYPGGQVVFPQGDAADGAAMMALDYLDGAVDFINDLP